MTPAILKVTVTLQGDDPPTIGPGPQLLINRAIAPAVSIYRGSKILFVTDGPKLVTSVAIWGVPDAASILEDMQANLVDDILTVLRAQLPGVQLVTEVELL